MGPVWEANHVWLLFFLTGLLAVFPGAFSRLGAMLFVPALLALLGLVVRGAALAFAAQLTRADRVRRPLQLAFGGASVATPLVLGATAAGLARETCWLGPFQLLVGLLAVSACASVAASFLTVEMGRAGEWGLAGAFRLWALRATAVTSVLAVAAAALAGPLQGGLTGRGLPALLAGFVALATALAALAARRDVVARAAVATAMAALVWGWGLAQYPRLACSRVTVASAAASPPELHAIAIALAAGAVLLAPAMWLLYVAFRRQPPEVAQ
jgi:cytochrome d ubiquinol oxidase subunit II